MREEGQISVLNGMVDTDAHPKYINTDTGHVYSRTNLRSGGSRGKKFINRKLKGTLLISTDLPAGTNKCIGWCNDTQNEAIVYFIHNSSDNHCVYRYYTRTATAQKLWYEEPDLGLEDDELRAVVVEGKVYWVNGSQSPKGFNLDMAANYTAGITENAYTSDDIPFVDNIFTLIKRPPQFAPTCEYDSDSSYNYNNLRKKLFQFKYAYQYYDDQISAWSSISKVALPSEEMTADGSFVDDITKNNLIHVYYNSGSHFVKKILFAARDTSPRNTGSFFQFEEIDKEELEIPDDSSEAVDFYNNKLTTSIDTEVGNRYCDWVPLSGKDILLLDSKYLGIAYPEEGYDEVFPDYELTAVEKEIETEGEIITHHTMKADTAYQWLQGCNATKYKMWYIDLPKTFYHNATYSISFSLSIGPNLYFSVSTGASDANYPESVRDSFLTAMRNYFDTYHPTIAYYIQNKTSGFFGGNDVTRSIALAFSSSGDICAGSSIKTIKNLKGTVTSGVSEIIPTSFKHLKRGQYHPFGLIYNDGYGRYNIVFEDKEDAELYSSLPDDDSDEQLAERVMCYWQINHRPPDWATTYRWAYIRNKTYSYFQYFSYVKSTKGTGVSTEVSGGNDIPLDKYFIEVNQSLQRIRDFFPNFIISDYVWQNGDRIRVLGENTSYEVLSEYTWITDEENASDGVTGILVDEALCTHGETDLNGNEYGYITLVEIYRPNPAPQEIYYLEIGEEFEILDAGTANRRHAGKTTDQSADLSTPAVGTMDFGDVYLRQRVVVDQSNAVHLPVIEDEYFNDYYRSDAIDVGRAGAKIETENKFLNRVIRGENYIENTQYNNLNVFLSGTDYFDASDEFGAITGIEHAGDVLKVIQPHKETSVYVGRNYVKQGDGSDIVIASDKVFNSPNRYIEFRGTTYRKSLISNNRYLYYFDESTGEFIRSSPNGQMALSSHYRNRTYFEAKAKELREYMGDKDVIVGINNDNEEVYLTFRIGDESETFVFSEEEENKGWMFFIELYNDSSIPENFAHFGDIMFSFLNGQLWMHDQTNNLNMFYGKQHYASLEFYVNKYANIVKRFKNIRISTTDNIWTIEFNIPIGLNYGNQKTTLIPAQLREREGQITSDILRNIINRNDTEDLSLLYRGQRMTGEFMKVKLSESSTDDAELREVEVKFLIST